MLLFCEVSRLDIALATITSHNRVEPLKFSATDCARSKTWDIPLSGHIQDVSQINQVNNRLIIISNISAP